MSPLARSLAQAAKALSHRLAGQAFGSPVTHVYDPLDYAWEAHEAYLALAGQGRKRVLFLGMNPGPFGMAQTGVPFGEVASVRDWMKIQAPVGKPAVEHPKRPVLGFDCPRSEVSGRRLWGLFAQRFGTAEAFFRDHFVANYCPLAFFIASGANYTPDKLPSTEREPIVAACNEHLQKVVSILEPEWIIGIGAFATQRAQEALPGCRATIGTVLHPSPASPAANRDWAGTATRQLEALGLWSKSGTP